MVYEVQVFLIVGAAILLDILTGIAQALHNKTLSSDKMRSGVYHKLSFIFAIALAMLIEYSVSYMDLGYTVPILIPTCTYLVLTEIVSITENISRLNPELSNSGVFKLLSSNKNRRKDDGQE